MRQRWSPGPILSGLARWIVPERIREPFVGDLVEESGERGPLWGRLWFLAQLTLSTPALVRWRLRQTAHGGGAAALLGILFALIWLWVSTLDSPVMLAVVCSMGAVLNGIAAFLIRDRTSFGLLAAVTLLGAVELGAFGILVLFVPYERLIALPAVWIVAGLSFLLYVTVWLWSRRSRPEEWRRWREAADEAGVLDFLAFRHIPDLEAE